MRNIQSCDLSEVVLFRFLAKKLLGSSVMWAFRARSACSSVARLLVIANAITE